MIIITGTVDIDPDRRDEALGAAEPHMRATRTLEGCLDYVWSGDPLVPGRIYVFERWESEADLAVEPVGAERGEFPEGLVVGLVGDAALVDLLLHS